MAVYSVAEARDNFTKLLARVEAGEEVRISRRGKLVARLAPIVAVSKPEDRPKAFNDMEWIRRHQVKLKDPSFDSAKLIRSMRDDYRY